MRVVGVLLLLGQSVLGESPFVETLRMSPGMTECFGINTHGWMWGHYEKISESSLTLTSFIRAGDAPYDVPIPETFTHVELQRASDAFLIAGFVTRPLGDPRGTQQAVVIDAATKRTDVLPLRSTYRGSIACDISRDGTRVSGFLVGRDPPRLVPCLWIRDAERWQCELLPTIFDYNPLLATARVVVSDDGKRIAASLVTHEQAEDVFLYGLFEWTQASDGTWLRRQLHDRAVHLADINDDGALAGRVLVEGRAQPIRYTPAAGVERLELPQGRAWGYTTDINARGDIVGIAEDPQGNEGGSHAVLWIDGRIAPLSELTRNALSDNRLSTAQAITDDRRMVGMVQIADNAGAETLEDHMEAYVVKLLEQPNTSAAPPSTR